MEEVGLVAWSTEHQTLSWQTAEHFLFQASNVDFFDSQLQLFLDINHVVITVTMTTKGLSLNKAEILSETMMFPQTSTNHSSLRDR